MKVTQLNSDQVPDMIFEEFAKMLEEIKRQNEIKRDEGIGYPVIIDIRNQSPHDIRDICLKMNIYCTAQSGDQYLLEFGSPTIELKRNRSLKAIVFDFSGFSETRIDLVDVNYKVENENSSNYFIKDSVLINKTDITNQFNGYSNYEEMETSFLLQNYLQNGFGARGLLLKLIFKTLDDVNKNSGFEYEGQQYLFDENEMSSIRSIIQIDIISTIMMYIEDLFTLLIAIKDSNGNYYKLLDKTFENNRDNKDLGDRINEFVKNEIILSAEDCKRMLSYAETDKIDIDESKKLSIKHLVESNITEFQKFYFKVKDFKDSHHKTFRRYKHAGFPIKLGYKSSMRFPFTEVKYDFYSMVFIGKDLFKEVIPLPYSNDIIESYKILIHGLQSRLKDIVENKIESTRRRTDGVLPKKSYSAPDTFTTQEISDIIITISKFNTQRPIRISRDGYEFPINTDIKQEMKWYIDLKDNMKEWKKMKDSEDTFKLL